MCGARVQGPRGVRRGRDRKLGHDLLLEELEVRVLLRQQARGLRQRRPLLDQLLRRRILQLGQLLLELPLGEEAPKPALALGLAWAHAVRSRSAAIHGRPRGFPTPEREEAECQSTAPRPSLAPLRALALGVILAAAATAATAAVLVLQRLVRGPLRHGLTDGTVGFHRCPARDHRPALPLQPGVRLAKDLLRHRLLLGGDVPGLDEAEQVRVRVAEHLLQPLVVLVRRRRPLQEAGRLYVIYGDYYRDL